jgi:hypothetical protein
MSEETRSSKTLSLSAVMLLLSICSVPAHHRREVGDLTQTVQEKSHRAKTKTTASPSASIGSPVSIEREPRVVLLDSERIHVRLDLDAVRAARGPLAVT